MKIGNRKYKQVILVPEHISATIFTLPCIFSVHKDNNGCLVYLLYDWDADGRYIELRPGQWLCEGYDGKWEVKDFDEFSSKNGLSNIPTE